MNVIGKVHGPIDFWGIDFWHHLLKITIALDVVSLLAGVPHNSIFVFVVSTSVAGCGIEDISPHYN